MADPAALSSGVTTSVGEALGLLILTAAGALGAGVAGYRQFLKRCTDGGTAARGERVDALIALTRTFEAFANTVGAFIIHVQEQHGQHQREMERQTAILDRLSTTVAEVKARQEVHGR